MNRYFYYNTALVGMLNLMLFVPYLLIQYRYTGALMSMGCAAAVGTTAAFLFMRVMRVYPGKGMPEILALHMPKLAVIPILLVWAANWLIAASISLYAYAVLINRFFNPDTNYMIVLLCLTLVCLYGATRSLLTVMFVIEMCLLLCSPFILFILFKAIRNPLLDWDAIGTIAQYWNRPPQLKPFAASTFVFAGYISFFLFNRLHSPNFRLRFRWLVPMFCSMMLLLSFFVPIGFHGTEGAANYLYIWSVTSDSLVMSYGFIERVLFVFLLLYLLLTLTFATMGWHMALDAVKACFPRSKPTIDPAKTSRADWIIAASFALITMLYAYLFNEKQNLAITGYWIVLRTFIELVTVLLLFAFSLKRAGNGKKLVQ